MGNVWDAPKRREIHAAAFRAFLRDHSLHHSAACALRSPARRATLGELGYRRAVQAAWVGGQPSYTIVLYYRHPFWACAIRRWGAQPGQFRLRCSTGACGVLALAVTKESDNFFRVRTRVIHTGSPGPPVPPLNNIQVVSLLYTGTAVRDTQGWGCGHVGVYSSAVSTSTFFG